ncbi:MAG: C10 family peptidase, partial [Promethearchaeota archaeon]
MSTNQILKKLKFKFTFIFLLFIFLTQLLFTYNLTLITKEESIIIAENWLNYINLLPLTDKIDSFYSIKGIEIIYYKNLPLCYLYHLYPKGHILVPAYKELVPIKSFSVVSDFNNMSEGYETMVLNILRGELDFLIKNKKQKEKIKILEEVIKENRNRWEFLKELTNIRMINATTEIMNRKGKINRFIFITNRGVILQSVEAPGLLESDWDQRHPFNSKCPLLNGQRCLVGCVATAMAQIMRYHEWPIFGEGNVKYWWPRGEQYIEADFEDYYYYHLMPVLKSDYDTQNEKDQVGEFCFDVGASVYTNYGTEGSSASIYSVDDALRNYFRYHNDVKTISHSHYNNTNTWFNILKEQRDLGWPVQLAIWKTNSDTGHAVVMDGYLITNDLYKVHINMGWGKNYIGYYTLDNIEGYDDVSTQKAVINIAPDIIELTPIVPSEMTVGEDYILEFHIKNKGVPGKEGYLDISFPSLSNLSIWNVEIYDTSNNWTTPPEAYDTNDYIWHRTKGQIPAEYPLISGYKSDWAQNEELWVKIKITPETSGNLKIYYRGTIFPSIDPANLLSETLDQQSWPVYEKNIIVKAKQPDIRTPIEPIHFPDTEIGKCSWFSTTIYNDGNDSLTINKITRKSGSADFTYSYPSTPFDIPAKSSKTITVKFCPSTEGSKSATFNVNSNDPDEGNVPFDVSGNGITKPDIRTPISNIDFGDVDVGSSVDKTTRIYNDGNGTLTINSIPRSSGSSDFTYIGPSTPFDISPNSYRDITIRFSPSTSGSKSATFNVNSNDPDEGNVPFDVSGNGICQKPSPPTGLTPCGGQFVTVPVILNWTPVSNAISYIV